MPVSCILIVDRFFMCKRAFHMQDKAYNSTLHSEHCQTPLPCLVVVVWSEWKLGKRAAACGCGLAVVLAPGPGCAIPSWSQSRSPPAHCPASGRARPEVSGDSVDATRKSFVLIRGAAHELTHPSARPWPQWAPTFYRKSKIANR